MLEYIPSDCAFSPPRQLPTYDYDKMVNYLTITTLLSLYLAVPSFAQVHNLVERFQGQDFFDKWDFFDQADPTHGSVTFLNKQDAQSTNLARVEGDTFVMAVDNTTQLPVGKPRNSIRISSQATYSTGLIIADIAHAPHGCSVWPAWWTVGPDWPNGGEIDVMEGINDGPLNQYTLHTSQGCSIDTNQKMAGKIGNANCAVGGGSNTGCGVQDTDPRSYGHGFNVAGGGVFAHNVDKSGISIWHFARSEVPQDIIDQKPDPSTWGEPVAFYAADSCDVASHFHDHVLTFDITLCGDWAGSAYSGSGCPGTCAEAVADPKNFDYAWWQVNSVAIYD